jgi:hypothetical protein
MLEFLSSPVPFVAGVHKRFAETALEAVGKDTCIADIDTGTVEFKDDSDTGFVGKTECEEIADFPKHEITKLLGRFTEAFWLCGLRKQKTNNTLS